MTMRDAQSQIRDALEYMMASTIPSEHKTVLIEALTQALRIQLDADARQQAAHEASAQWKAEEIASLRSFLSGNVAKSWQHGDELAMRLAARLHRSLDDVRAKAIELGFGECIDYRSALLVKSH